MENQKKVKQEFSTAQKIRFWVRMFLILVVVAAGVWVKFYTDLNISSGGLVLGSGVVIIFILIVTGTIHNVATGKNDDL